mmetsp:Transcript_1831/g.2772  ORF Transcript_1831/g.2772 Transcript_1831/m.2772 type:complete len:266 (-) Transcript_1831:153-950(-)|eukprot:CAMPEP_0195526296 /NCGR_PEP_ID=MMETSP0794_2-20130614/27279_1 /TAXON_ID=515487 /ORGANISM="Stephanopyxis turris, Strain CCMP 815" /LENGTH=265 /DNA_ID=CAMNT_0040656949 /DNA_START=27 /DNA_END=824 /DNA_ORIENTATION=-
MSNNLYGYTDYNGPSCTKESNKQEQSTVAEEDTATKYNDSEEEDNPLRVGQWMEGDSLAPPCGTSLSVVHSMLSLISPRLNSDDVLYDLGCGDGRLCLEAFMNYNCKMCVGVEIEEDLAERFQTLIDEVMTMRRNGGDDGHDVVKEIPIKVVQGDLREVLDALLQRSEREQSNDNSNNNDDDCCEQQQDGTYTELPLPTVICLYLLPEAIAQIESQLVSLMKSNSSLRVLCNTWGLQTIEPVHVLDVDDGVSTTCLSLYTCASAN